MEALCSCSQFKNGNAEVSTSVYRNFFCDTTPVFIHQKTDKQSKNSLLLSKISQPNCKWLFFAVKYGAPYGGIRDSGQLHRDAIWGYPEYGASYCVRHMVSPRLDGLKTDCPFKNQDPKFLSSRIPQHASQ